MRYTRFFAFILTLFVATSCYVDDIDIPAINRPAGSCDNVMIAARITCFDDREVDTRANKTAEESYLSSMALAVFPIEGDTVGDCISYTHLKGSNLTFTLDRKEIPARYYDKPFVLYIFANMPALPATFAELTDKSLKWFKEQEYVNNGIRRPQTGFPMVGSLGDNVSEDGDGTTFVLMPTRKDAQGNMIPLKDENGDPVVDAEGNTIAEKITLPLVGGEPKDYIPIPMKALYAKFSFTITCEPDQHMQNGDMPVFTMDKYTINNIPESVCINKDLNDEGTVSKANSQTATLQSATNNEEAKISFEFYLPERFLTPKTTSDKYTYPFGSYNAATGKYDAPTTGYTNVRAEDQKYCQRFKGDLLDRDASGPLQLATYITIHGYFHDHQGHDYEVSYNIYLGADNYSDFNVIRNTDYENNVVIRGITATHDSAESEYGVFVDHRVNIARTLPIIINLQRETLLDSHFEVRPIRIRSASGSVIEGATATVEVVPLNEGDDVSWVRLEHNNGGAADATYCASGKRRYFTTDLVTTTLKNNGTSNGHKVGSKIEIPTINGDNQTVWIYIDQCNQVDAKDPNAVRKAVIRVTYTANNGNKETVDYVIQQHLLYPVKTERKATDVANTSVPMGEYTYYIEYEEEYLHNYDSEDSYGLTEYSGMEWGLNGIQLSHLHDALHVKASTQSGWGSLIGEDVETMCNDALNDNDIDPKYDFYIPRDTDNTSLEIRSYVGYTFNTEMASYLKSQYSSHQGQNSTADAKIDGIALDETPKSAYAYCYNRNKRNANGVVEKIEWYLPAIDEIEDVVEWGYGDFDVQFQGNMYWSCQPSYSTIDIQFEYWEKGSIFGSFKQYDDIIGAYYIDDTSRARATKALKEGGVFSGVPSSAANAMGKQRGVLRVTSSLLNIPPEYSHGDYEEYATDPYKGHEGNLPRKGAKARVRCVRISDGVTVLNSNN